EEEQMMFGIARAETARKPPTRQRDQDPIEAHRDVHEEPSAGTAARERAGRALVPVHVTPPIVPRRYGGTRVFASLAASIYMGRVSGRPCADRQRDLAVERLEEPNEPIDRLVVVGLVEKAIELRGRGSETADDLTAREWTSREPLLRLDRQRVEQTVSEMIGIFVVVEHLLDMDRALTTRCEGVGDCLGSELAIHTNLSNWI